MRDEFTFDHISSVEFCINVENDEEIGNFQVPIDDSVQDALRDMLRSTADRLDGGVLGEPEWRNYELSEKYGSSESLVADVDADEMASAKSLFDMEGMESNPNALLEPADVSYYFGVFHDAEDRKLVAVRRATQFKGVVASRLVRLFDDSLRMIEDHVFKLDHDFDFIITSEHVYILHPTGFEFIAGIDDLVSAKAQEKAVALGGTIKFANFDRIAEFVTRKKRAARLVAALSARSDLDKVKRSKFIVAAKETNVELETIGQKIAPKPGSEFGFLELLDRRRYTTAIKTGAKEAFVANSRKQIV